jgi:hypothetical protein
VQKLAYGPLFEQRPSLRSGKPYVPEKMSGTLTSSILTSVYTLVPPIFSQKLYSVATPGVSKSLLLENYVRIVALRLVCKACPFIA